MGIHSPRTPSSRLRQQILAHITEDERRRARKYVFISAGAILVSVAAIGMSLQNLAQALYQSGAYSYLSLLFSDTDAVVRNWQAFSLSFLESLPVIGILACLIALFVLLVSIRTLAVNLRGVLTPVLSS